MDASVIYETISRGGFEETVLGDRINAIIEDMVHESHSTGSDQSKRSFPIESYHRDRDRGYALREMEALSDKQFTTMFRLNKLVFFYLLAKINPLISARGSLRNNLYHHLSDVSPQTKLAVTLR